MVISVILFCVGLVLLIKGGDWFVDGSCGIAKRFRIPEILIGATVVSIGTTLPEVMVSATSAVSGHSEMAYGNALGSIICNTALVAAITIAIKPSKINRKPLIIPIIAFFASAIVYSVVSYTSGYFGRLLGILLLCIFCGYMVLSIMQSIKTPSLEAPDVKEEPQDHEEVKRSPLWKDILFLVLGAAFIAVGAKLLVDHGTVIATELGVPEAVIALTFVALGTSLPELVTAITALVKGHGALSLGNIIGANLFNLVLVSGVSMTLCPFSVPENNTIAGINTSLLVDIPVMLAVMLIMTVPTLIRGKLSRWQGFLLLAIYAGFCVFQFAV